MVCECENNSKSNCKQLEAIFSQEMSINAQNSIEKRHVLNKSSFTGVKAGEHLTQNDAERMCVKIHGLEVAGKAKHTGGGNLYNTTTQGSLINCDFYLSVRANMNACICGDHPQAKLPLVVFNPSMEQQNYEPPMGFGEIYPVYIAHIGGAHQEPVVNLGLSDFNLDYMKPDYNSGRGNSGKNSAKNSAKNSERKHQYDDEILY
jgi:hypothetical protein